MRTICTLTLTTLLLSSGSLAFCQDNKWSLPLNLQDKNTKISFEVDSTWVLVQGETSGLKGEVKYTPDQANTFETILTIPVSSMKTGLEARDTKLLRLMAADRYPQIELHLLASDLDCNPSKLAGAETCILKQKGKLEIRGITREVSLNSMILKTTEGYSAEGEISFPWADFEVEDPSILVAKLDPEVKVIYKIAW